MAKLTNPPKINYAEYADEHLRYEARMFVVTRQILGQAAIDEPQNVALKNAVIESWVLHLRNLIDFFYPTNKPKRDDVIAEYYAAGWHTHKPSLTSSLHAARGRAHKELAHLTTHRIAGLPPHKLWNFVQLSSELRPIITAFITHADPRKLPVQTVQELRTI